MKIVYELRVSTDTLKGYTSYKYTSIDEALSAFKKYSENGSQCALYNLN